MAAKFGTSGLRGLVTELSDDVVADYVSAFARACPTGAGVYVGRDLRDSSPAIAAQVRRTLAGAGLSATDCGVLPTPALALAATRSGAAAIMVTGSHIPADRNGLKFYTPHGEITKANETAILGALGAAFPDGEDPGAGEASAEQAYGARYVDAFGEALAGLRVGIYQHSSVARDLMVTVVEALGGEAITLARSDSFVPVDTEAVDADTRAMLAQWCAENRLDTVISTDGDADRPMVTDQTGRIVPGDVLGPLTARALGARIVCTPVSSNTLVDAVPGFDRICRTRIGSPFVIEAMEAVLDSDPAARVVGYEANGGFLLGFEADGPAGRLDPLPTRDCLLPILATLSQAKDAGGLAALVAALPKRFTAADRIAGIPSERSQSFIAGLTDDRARRDAFFTDPGSEAWVDMTDGLRVTFANGEIVHLRPSGNAPEFRCYAEADDPQRAEVLVASYLEKLRTELA
ncbi:phosphomannomutase [Citreimonas salinaria]|uniref:Phosphomannomutase n=1 Tax=Citreimonas salinaria TaxID=321339 RepID=A0A1H3LRH8_9RHOB|nr:phosphomannomutase [Citreimonas salinaria]SDY67042.1 phosphomannomutase [Citreimonas salinaria]